MGCLPSTGAGFRNHPQLYTLHQHINQAISTFIKLYLWLASGIQRSEITQWLILNCHVWGHQGVYQVIVVANGFYKEENKLVPLQNSHLPRSVASYQMDVPRSYMFVRLCIHTSHACTNYTQGTNSHNAQKLHEVTNYTLSAYHCWGYQIALTLLPSTVDWCVAQVL